MVQASQIRGIMTFSTVVCYPTFKCVFLKTVFFKSGKMIAATNLYRFARNFAINFSDTLSCG